MLLFHYSIKGLVIFLLNITDLNRLKNFGFDKVNYRESLVMTSKEQYILEIVTGYPFLL